MAASMSINGVPASLEGDANFVEIANFVGGDGDVVGYATVGDDGSTSSPMNASGRAVLHSGSTSPTVAGGNGRTAAAAHPTSFPHGGLSSPYGTAQQQCNIPPMISTVPLNSPGSPSQQNGGDSKLMRTPQSKIDTIKQWSISTYKCTRQIISEKLGKTSRTVDPELEGQIEGLRDTQRKYASILRLARALTSHFYHVVQTQQALGDVFADLAQKSPQLQEEFLYNADTQRNLTKNGETLLGALNFFVSTVSTLCNKTMEDTLQTVKQYEMERVEYDAYRTDLQLLVQASPTASTDTLASSTKLDEAKANFDVHKQRFENLRQDVAIKLKFLEENKVKVMHKQLLLFHNAVSAYFSGNQQALEATLKQFNIKLKAPNAGSPSWIEQ